MPFSQGKRRKQGTRPPYSWAVPRPSFLGTEAFDFLIRVLDKMGRPSFFIPARESRKAHFMRYAWRSQPMPYVMEVYLLKQALQQIGAEKGRIEQATFNTMRRFMPTACAMVRLEAGPAAR